MVEELAQVEKEQRKARLKTSIAAIYLPQSEYAAIRIFALF